MAASRTVCLPRSPSMMRFRPSRSLRRMRQRIDPTPARRCVGIGVSRPWAWAPPGTASARVGHSMRWAGCALRRRPRLERRASTALRERQRIIAEAVGGFATRRAGRRGLRLAPAARPRGADAARLRCRPVPPGAAARRCCGYDAGPADGFQLAHEGHVHALQAASPRVRTRAAESAKPVTWRSRAGPRPTAPTVASAQRRRDRYAVSAAMQPACRRRRGRRRSARRRQRHGARG